MKLLRRLCYILLVLIFFFAGVCIADKQYFKENVVGICIVAGQNDSASVQALCDYVEQLQYADAADLCRQIQSTDFSGQVMCKKQYFETCVTENGVIPAGVYDSVCILLTGDSERAAVYSTLTGDRFAMPDEPVTLILQNSYVSVLSLIGKLDRLMLKEI